MLRLMGAMSIGGMLAIAAYGQMYSFSGTVKDTTGHVVPSATVTAKSLVGGKIFTVHANSEGAYTIPDLKAGDYRVSARAGELIAQPIKVTLAAGQTTDLVVSPRPRLKPR